VSDPLLSIVQAGIHVVDLGRQLRVGMPQSPNHAAFNHALPRRHGDVTRVDGGSAANDVIMMGTHVGTHIDALAHVSHDGKLHGGLDAERASSGGRFDALGVHAVDPMVRRGVLLDIAGLRGEPHCPGGYEITVEDLEEASAVHGLSVGAGDIVLIRSGWGSKFVEGDAYVGRETGVPGVGEAGARWLADRQVLAAGADTIAFECLAPLAGHASLPAHRVLLVEHGIFIIEALDLEQLADEGAHEFTLVLIPLNIYGATGSPVRPVAVFPR